MSCEVVWLPSAARDMARLREFIQTKNPAAAQRASSRILEAVNILKENSEAGKPVEGLLSFRDLLIPFGSGNYVVRYRNESKYGSHRLVIVRVRHSKEESFS